MTPIIVEYHITQDDNERAFKYHAKVSRLSSICALLAIILFFAAFASIISLGKLRFFFAIGYFLIGLFIFLLPLQAKTLLRKKDYYGLKLRVECDEQGMAIYTENTKTNLPWEMIKKVCQSWDGFLLYHDTHRYQWLPARGFSSDSDLKRMEELVKRKVKNYRMIS